MKRELKPYVGQREDGQEVADEVEHFYRCKACGQLVDKRDLAAVFHHEERGHAPLAAEEAYRLVGVDHQVAAATAKPRRRRRASAPMSAFQMFAFPKLVDKAPEGLGWIHEIKYDGYRMQLRVEGGQARLFTRNGYDWTSKLHLLAAHAGVALDADCLLDAELCAIGEDGVPSFELLQSRKPTSHLVLFVFDALWIGGEDLRDRPLVERKARLAALLEAAGSKRLRYVDHFTDAVGAHALFQAACDMKLEGIVSKKELSPYRAGKDGTWLKTKCRPGQEFVLGGWVAEGPRLKSLITGVYDGGALRYTGRVKSGFGERALRELGPRLAGLERKTSPFKGPGRLGDGGVARWLRPELVARVEFAEWQSDGTLRQASYKGLRDDKPAREVVREG